MKKSMPSPFPRALKAKRRPPSMLNFESAKEGEGRHPTA